MDRPQPDAAACRAWRRGRLLTPESLRTEDGPGRWRAVVATGAVAASYGAIVAAANRVALPRLCEGAALTESVTVIVPARDEATRIADVISDLRAQTGLPRLQVLILDDDSADGTADVARRAVAGDPRFTVVRSTAPPPPGWTGKAAACARAYSESGAAGRSGSIVFVDADVRLAPGAVAAAVTLLRERTAGLVSPWPLQVSGSAAEHLVQPLLFWSWFSILPVAVAHRTRRASMAVACGQFLAFDAAAYTAFGGHAAVASSPTEDLDLARTVRKSGRHTVVAAAGPLASCRMYEGRSALTGGYTRWLWSAFGSPLGAVAVVAAYTVAYVLPPIAAILGDDATRRWGVLGTSAAIVSRLVARRTERGTPLRTTDAFGALAHPAAIVAFGRLTAASVRARRAGRAIWKDRTLP